MNAFGVRAFCSEIAERSVSLDSTIPVAVTGTLKPYRIPESADEALLRGSYPNESRPTSTSVNARSAGNRPLSAFDESRSNAGRPTRLDNEGTMIPAATMRTHAAISVAARLPESGVAKRRAIADGTPGLPELALAAARHAEGLCPSHRVSEASSSSRSSFAFISSSQSTMETLLRTGFSRSAFATDLSRWEPILLYPLSRLQPGLSESAFEKSRLKPAEIPAAPEPPTVVGGKIRSAEGRPKSAESRRIDCSQQASFVRNLGVLDLRRLSPGRGGRITRRFASFAPAGAEVTREWHPTASPWATFCRRSAAVLVDSKGDIRDIEAIMRKSCSSNRN